MIYRINPDIVWTDSDGEIRLYDPANGDFQTLNGSASEIWRLVAEDMSEDAIISNLQQKYVSADAAVATVLGRDTRRFLATLASTGLLTSHADSDLVGEH